MTLEAKLAEIQGILTPEHFPSEAAVSHEVLEALRERRRLEKARRAIPSAWRDIFKGGECRQ